MSYNRTTSLYFEICAWLACKCAEQLSPSDLVALQMRLLCIHGISKIKTSVSMECDCVNSPAHRYCPLTSCHADLQHVMGAAQPSNRLVRRSSHAAPAVGGDVGAHSQGILNALDRSTGDHMPIQARDGFAPHELHLPQAMPQHEHMSRGPDR